MNYMQKTTKEQTVQSYTEAENYIMKIPKFVPGRTLKDTGRLLGQITGETVKSSIIHIAGTNGTFSVRSEEHTSELQSQR